MVNTAILNQSTDFNTEIIPSSLIAEDMTIQIEGRGFTNIAHVALIGDLVTVTNNPHDDEVLSPIAEFPLTGSVQMLVSGI